VLLVKIAGGCTPDPLLLLAACFSLVLLKCLLTVASIVDFLNSKRTYLFLHEYLDSVVIGYVFFIS
jgi:hypothetical protein